MRRRPPTPPASTPRPTWARALGPPRTKAPRSGRTTAVYAPLAADAAAFHTLANVDRVMGSSASKGTARIMLTITGHRAGGRVFTVRHGDVLTATSGDDALDLQVAMMV